MPSYSYKSILRISTPIMIASAVQNLITLTDLIFLGRTEEAEINLGAISLVGTFYLTLSAMGYGFSRGGQIMIARRLGEKRYPEIGRASHVMLLFGLLLSLILFVLCWFGSPYLFGGTKSPEIYAASMDYLTYRLWSLPATFVGVGMISMYTGYARTKIITVNAVSMGFLNLFLNYSLVFGNFGFPAMDIAGAALASTIAEMGALLVFVIYLPLDKHLKQYDFWTNVKWDWQVLKQQMKLALPIVLQSVLGMGSWLLFFFFIEQMGEFELAVSNVMRAAYLIFMIPCWGLSSGINTMVSHLIGLDKRQGVMPLIRRTAFLSWFITALFTLSLIFLPEWVFALGTDDPVLLEGALELSWILVLALWLLSISTIYFNGLAGTGATIQGLYIQFWAACIYLVYAYIVIFLLDSGLVLAWFAELIYWLGVFGFSFWFLKKGYWRKITV